MNLRSAELISVHFNNSILWSFVGLPAELKYDFARWNSMTHGNITFVVFLLSMRHVFK